jgi:WD40 repeat protein
MRFRWCGVALLLAACKTVPVTPPAVLAQLEKGGHLSGVPVALGSSAVLNAEDFVYDAKLSPDSKRAAVSRLGPKSFHLTTHELGTKTKRDVVLNPLEFDVESLEFSPDGATVATVSRDGALRLHSAATGQLVAQWLTEEPLVSLAWSRDGAFLALGSVKGLVTVLAVPAMQFVAEVRAHLDEVRGLAFTPQRELLSAGWDAKLLAFTLEETSAPSRELRTHFTKKNGVISLRAVLDGAASATLALDARSPMITINAALAQALGIDTLALTDTTQVPTAFGPQVVKVAKNRTLAIKNVQLTGLDVAICDACVPPDLQGVLGGPALASLPFAFDESTGELVFTLPEGRLGTTLALKRARTMTMPAPINDLSLDAAGTTAGLAFSETKAERTRAVYEREKKGEIEPAREWDCGARVDVLTGHVIEKKTGHRGVVATAGISPDGHTLATGGWDKKVIVHGATPLIDDRFGWAVRRVRFSANGRWLIVAAWTPQNPLGDHQSNPSAVVTELVYADANHVP